MICIIILALGLAGAGYIKRSAPQAQKRPPQRTVLRVSTQPLFPDFHQVTVSAMGVVIPARTITLKSRVAGQIQSVHPEFVEGGLIRAGQKVLKIDPQDYQLAIARQESAVVDAEYALKVEMGYQEVARREWALLKPDAASDKEDAELALRKPHLAKAKSDLASARAQLAQARLDLSRTDVRAPFNAVVRVKHVSVGSQVSTQDALADWWEPMPIGSRYPCRWSVWIGFKFRGRRRKRVRMRPFSTAAASATEPWPVCSAIWKPRAAWPGFWSRSRIRSD
ncbi:efflux RND transporter periplasmic adaptor subunit [Desulfosarcina cetonica]|uniref:efflux RND transporter periplasmic adaptor subunit n=1 Tax=Desulfosarcina cetonica TaxID=90730 RepID=UPI0006D10BF6|nr:hypothetical protein [Desulfosarcina cetonica]